MTTTPHTAEALAKEMWAYGQTTMNRWALDGATLIRAQAAEIERLRSALAGVIPMVENWVDCGHDFNECANVRIRDAARAELHVAYLGRSRTAFLAALDRIEKATPTKSAPLRKPVDFLCTSAERVQKDGESVHDAAQIRALFEEDDR